MRLSELNDGRVPQLLNCPISNLRVDKCGSGANGLVRCLQGGASDGEAAAVVVPRLASYSEAWQARLLQELEAAGAPCHRQDPAPGCVAWPQGIADYLTLRDQVRAAAGSVDPP